jgi:hypothetical protein
MPSAVPLDELVLVLAAFLGGVCKQIEPLREGVPKVRRLGSGRAIASWLPLVFRAAGMHNERLHSASIRQAACGFVSRFRLLIAVQGCRPAQTVRRPVAFARWRLVICRRAMLADRGAILCLSRSRLPVGYRATMAAMTARVTPAAAHSRMKPWPSPPATVLEV